MYKEVENYCATCQECLANKLHPEIKGPLCPIECNYAFEKVGVDLMGPFPETTLGMKYILIFIYSLTKCIECIISKTDASEIAKFLYERVICRHGCPSILSSDTAKHLSANVLTEVCNILNVKRNYSPSSYPMSNGIIERLIGTITRMLSFYVNKNQTDWDTLIPSIAFAYHTSYHSSVKLTSFELLYIIRYFGLN